jgi:hypothetical protein
MNIRHGDLALIGISALPKNLTVIAIPSTSKKLMTGSGGNDHTFTLGTFYPNIDGQTLGYLVAVDGTKLLHPDHGALVANSNLREVIVPAGIYQVVRQVEQTHDAMRFVED